VQLFFEFLENVRVMSASYGGYWNKQSQKMGCTNRVQSGKILFWTFF